MLTQQRQAIYYRPLALQFRKCHENKTIAVQQHRHRQYEFVPSFTEPKRLLPRFEPQVRPTLAKRLRDLPLIIENLFLPRDWNTSTSKDYLPYVKWQFLANVASSACGVLSMQSLLYAIGLESGAIPMAAALNWVIKDGLGQFGGVLFASMVNHRYDADPKVLNTSLYTGRNS
jgi:hypothetical protein